MSTYHRFEDPLKDQLRRAALSVMANIAEGLERSGNRELLNFLSIAKGSRGEVRSHLYLLRDRNYIDETTFSELVQKSTVISSKIGGFMRYLGGSDFKGPKFKEEASQYGVEY